MRFSSWEWMISWRSYCWALLGMEILPNFSFPLEHTSISKLSLFFSFSFVSHLHILWYRLSCFTTSLYEQYLTSFLSPLFIQLVSLFFSAINDEELRNSSPIFNELGPKTQQADYSPRQEQIGKGSRKQWIRTQILKCQETFLLIGLKEYYFW